MCQMDTMPCQWLENLWNTVKRRGIFITSDIFAKVKNWRNIMYGSVEDNIVKFFNDRSVWWLNLRITASFSDQNVAVSTTSYPCNKFYDDILTPSL